MAAIKQCLLIGRLGNAFCGSLNFYLSTFRVPHSHSGEGKRVTVRAEE